MDDRESMTGAGTQVMPSWRIGESLRDRAAPELVSCELFSSRLGFDRAGLTISVSVDEAWGLLGSDPQLQRLVMQEQTVLQGPNTDALTAMVGVNVADVHGAGSQWPMLMETGVLDDATYRCLVVVPIGRTVTGPPLGTFSVARDSARPFTTGETAQVVRYGQVLAGLILFRWHTSHDIDRLEGLVLDERHLAAGMLASLLGLQTNQAMAVLRARAFSEGRTLAEFSADLITVLRAGTTGTTDGDL